jgi:hypothetical protein
MNNLKFYLGLAQVAESLNLEGGKGAAALTVAEQYVKSFSQLAKSSNTLIIPAHASDANSMIAQAMTIYQKLSTQQLEALPSDPSTFKKPE